MNLNVGLYKELQCVLKLYLIKIRDFQALFPENLSDKVEYKLSTYLKRSAYKINAATISDQISLTIKNGRR